MMSEPQWVNGILEGREWVFGKDGKLIEVNSEQQSTRPTTILNEGEETTMTDMTEINDLDEDECRDRLVQFGKQQLTTEQTLELMGLLTRLSELKAEQYNDQLQAICDAIATVDEKAECAHQAACEGYEEIADAVDEYFGDEVTPLLESLSDRLDESESETLSAEYMVQGLAQLLNVSPENLIAAARAARAASLSKDHGNFAQGVEDGAHGKNLGSVKGSGPRPSAGSDGDLGGVVKEDEFHNRLVDAVMLHEDKVARYSPTRKLI